MGVERVTRVSFGYCLSQTPNNLIHVYVGKMQVSTDTTSGQRRPTPYSAIYLRMLVVGQLNFSFILVRLGHRNIDMNLGAL